MAEKETGLFPKPRPELPPRCHEGKAIELADEAMKLRAGAKWFLFQIEWLMEYPTESNDYQVISIIFSRDRT